MDPSNKSWPDYRAVWRWHFYAGLFCMPFVIVLAISGSIYLFKPQIEAWLDQPYDHLAYVGDPLAPSAQVAAALKARPDAKFQSYELPLGPRSAARIIIRDQVESHRLYVHPRTLTILHSVPEDERLMRAVFRLHGELWLGERGSYLVEMAASWTIVMVLTGLVLWWPRQSTGLAGVLYPRLRAAGRVFWRDLHSVTGVWVSVFTLVLLLTGLPWSKFWGEYFKAARRATGTAVAKQDWSTGREQAVSSEHMGHAAQTNKPTASDSLAKNSQAHAQAGHSHTGHSHAGELRQGKSRGGAVRKLSPAELARLDTVVAAAIREQLDSPVVITPPASASSLEWSVKSMTGNRPRRENLTVDGATGRTLARDGFRDRHWVDKIVAVGIALHEGQLFGWLNQLLGLATAAGLVLLSVSGFTLWWRRRMPGTLGAPARHLPARFSWGLALAVLALAIYLPLFGLSLLVVLALERFVFARIPAVASWLGLRGATA